MAGSELTDAPRGEPFSLSQNARRAAPVRYPSTMSTSASAPVLYAVRDSFIHHPDTICGTPVDTFRTSVVAAAIRASAALAKSVICEAACV